MKQAKSIIGHLTNTPTYDNLEKIRCYKALMEFFPISIREGIKFMHNKNDTLFIAFKHQGYWMEFNNHLRKYQMEYKQNYIKNTLKRLTNLNPFCKCILAKSIKSFYIDTFEDEEMAQDTLPYFNEKSKAEFKNNIKDKKLHSLFEQIREIICLQKP